MNTVKGILIGVAIIVLCIAIGFGSGFLQAAYNRIVGTEIESSKHEIYKENKSYVEGMIKDLANYKMQYEQAESEQDKTAIKSRIVNDFANFDINEIENDGLKSFLIRMRGF